MKTRNGFVSNSSSSSFLVYEKGVNSYKDFDKDRYSSLIDRLVVKCYGNYKVIGLPNRNLGEYEFGWEDKQYIDLFSKLNFCAIQCIEMPRNDLGWKRISNFERAVKDILGFGVVYDYNAVYSDSITDRWAYIDHQSSAIEGVNVDIFDSVEDLKEFIFGENSYIQGGNDNEDYSDDYTESREKMEDE